MTFAAPQALILLLTVVLAAGLFRLAFAWKARTLALLAISSSPALLANAASHPRQVLKAALLLIGLAAIVFALARPHVGQAPLPTPPSTGDLMVVMDVSLSMASNDVSPSRLDAAKLQVSGLLERLQGERIGLAVFAGSSALRFPLTRDYEVAATLLRAVEIDSAPTPGSAYGEGIRTAVGALRQSEASLRAVFVVGDGESFSGETAAAAQEAADLGISIQAVGVGTPDGGMIPIVSPGGGAPSPKRDGNGQPVVTRLQEEGLRQLADRTGGVYRRGSPGGRELQQLYEGLAQRFASGDQRQPLDASDVTPYFALLAFLMLLTEWLVPERRPTASGSIRERGRVIGSSPILPVMLIAFTGCTLASAVAFELNEQGTALYQEGRFQDALEKFRKAQVEQPDLPQLDFNAGTGLYQTNEVERSLPETQRALNSESPEIRAFAHYNMGNAYFRLNRFQDAYEEYKKSLRDNPADMDAKVNLELALHRLRQEQQQQGDRGSQQPRPGQGQPQQGDQPGSSQTNPGQNQNPASPESVARAIQAAGELSIEETLRVLDMLRTREQQFQRQYNRAQVPSRTVDRPEKDW